MTYNLLKKYENFHLAQGTFYGGKVETSKLVDNGNPGMGTYDPLDQFKPPSYLIKKKENHSRIDAKKNPPGPGEYDPQWSYEIVPRGIQTGISIGNAVRREETGTYKLAPASNTYNTLGDFDFKDTTLPAGEVLHDRGKQPKFAFGGKHKIKSPSAEFPGPAEYETDVYPMSNKNVAYWIGTDVRRDLSVPYSHMYPGPGLYNPDNPSQQIAAHVS